MQNKQKGVDSNDRFDPQPCFTVCINTVGAKDEKYIFHLGSFVLSGQKGKPELGYAQPQKTSALQRSSAHYTYHL